MATLENAASAIYNWEERVRQPRWYFFA